MENPQGNNQADTTDEYLFLGIHPQEQHVTRRVGPQAEQQQAGGQREARGSSESREEKESGVKKRKGPSLSAVGRQR